MQDFTRRALLQGGTALAAGAALTGPALLDWAKAWAEDAPWKPEAGAKLTLMRWKRFVPAEDDAFNAIVAAFQKATGTEMNVFSESFEDVQPKASVAANTGSGLDMAWGLHTLPQLFPTKVIKMNDVADYLGKKYGGWSDAAAKTCQLGNDWLGIPVATVGGYMTYRKSATDKAGFKEFPKDFPGFLEMCKALKANNTPAGFALGHASGDANGWLLTLGCAVLGALAARALKMTAGMLLGPMILAGALTLAGVRFAVPPAVQQVAFAAIGLQVGLKFTVGTVKLLGRLVVPVLVALMAGLAACCGLAAVLAATTDISLLDAYLATTPGGLYAVLAIAFGAKANTTFILATQGLRLIVMVVLAPLAVRWMFRRPQAIAGAPSGRRSSAD